MNFLEKLFLTIGFNWTFSKLFIFLIILLVSISFAVLQSRWKSENKLIKWFRIVVISIFPVLLYFGLHPIYTGDLFDDSIKVNSNYNFDSEKKLNVIVLKNCPYCEKTVEITNMLIQRNPTMHINYIVVGFDNEKRGFLDQINNKCTVLFENNPSSVSSITKGNYPCFVLSSKNKIHKTWTSSDFGFRSLDVIEEFFEDN